MHKLVRGGVVDTGHSTQSLFLAPYGMNKPARGEVLDTKLCLPGYFSGPGRGVPQTNEGGRI